MSRSAQRYIIDGLSEKSSVVPEPWERLLDILAVAGARCEWQGDKGQRYFTIMSKNFNIPLVPYTQSLELVLLVLTTVFVVGR